MKRYIIFSILFVLGISSVLGAAEIAFMYGDLYGILAGIIPVSLFIAGLKIVSYEPSFRKFFYLDKNIEKPMLVMPDGMHVGTPSELTADQVSFINHWGFGGMLSWIYLWSSRMGNEAAKIFIPIYGDLSASRLVLHGRRIVWDARVWPDFKSFKKRQVLLDVIALVLYTSWFLMIILSIAYIN